jgi:hypothetical protein
MVIIGKHAMPNLEFRIVPAGAITFKMCLMEAVI